MKDNLGRHCTINFNVVKWFIEFHCGRTNMSDIQLRSLHPKLFQKPTIGSAILNDHFAMGKLSARWMTRSVLLNYRRIRMPISKKCLTLFSRNTGDLFHNRRRIIEIPRYRTLSNNQFLRANPRKDF